MHQHALSSRCSSAACGCVSGATTLQRCAHAAPALRRAAPAPTRAGFLDGLFGGGAKKPADGGKKPPAKGGGMRVVAGSCSACANKGGVTCKGCKGSGRNKANGNPFERFKCYDCQARIAWCDCKR